MERNVVRAKTATNRPLETVTAQEKMVAKTKSRKKNPMMPGCMPNTANNMLGAINPTSATVSGRRAAIEGGTMTPRLNIAKEVAITKARQSLAEKIRVK